MSCLQSFASPIYLEFCMVDQQNVGGTYELKERKKKKSFKKLKPEKCGIDFSLIALSQYKKTILHITYRRQFFFQIYVCNQLETMSVITSL